MPHRPNHCRQRSAPTRDHRRYTTSFGLKISKAGALYILITILLGFSAVNTGNNLLFLVVAGLLAFMAVTGYAGMQNIKNIIPELFPPDELFAGRPGRFKLLLRNTKSLWPSFLIRVAAPGQAETLIPFLKSTETIHAELQLTFTQRGLQPLGQLRISSPFPVNFFIRYWNYALTDTCIVFPHPLPCSGNRPDDDQTRVGETLQYHRGLDGELEGIREYSGSEPLRTIHWKLSARDQQLLVKQFGSHTAPPLLIKVDELPGATSEERLSQATWLITQQEQQRAVGMQLAEQVFAPGHGRLHRLELLTALAHYAEH